MQRFVQGYRRSFSGLSPSIWWLTLVTLINRSGTMVIPFLAVYLNDVLHFSLSDTGWIMTAFGAGSFLGAFLGGKLTDRIGYYQVMIWSLGISGVLFIGLQWINGFWEFVVYIFVLTMIADAFRPANLTAVAAYSKPENRTRSLSLIRLAINLGFAIGPAVGGFTAYYAGYKWLFWMDGLTCLFAVLLFWLKLSPRKNPNAESPETEQEQTDLKATQPHRDGIYLLFLLAVSLSAIAFMQVFTSIPVYIKSVLGIAEGQLGALMAMNGLLIVVFEMPLVYWLERRFRPLQLSAAGAFLIGVSLLMYNLGPIWKYIIWPSEIVLTLGEMLLFPFSNSIVLQRAAPKVRGQYMAFYTMAFSLAHILAPSFGLQTAAFFGFRYLWPLCALLTLSATFIFIRLQHSLKSI